MESKQRLNGPIILVRGAGEQASGVGWTLAKAGFRVVMTEVVKPLMVRWPVSFGTAVTEEEWSVDGMTSCRVENPRQCEDAWELGKIPILVDPMLEGLTAIQPVVLIDAILAKRNTGTKRAMAPFTVGLGPGFSAGDDVDLVIETNRGHDLGRLIYSGPAQPNTGIPGDVAGFSRERVVYSTMAGIFHASRRIGEFVAAGERLGEIQGEQDAAVNVISPLDGVLRGLLQTGTPIEKAVKIGDVDPRGQEAYCWTISEKARAIGSAVLLGILEWNRLHSRA